MTVKVWDAAIGTLQQTLEGYSAPLRSIAFSHNSKLLVSASYDKTVKVWDAATGTLQQTLEGHSSWVYSVAFSYNSKLLASASFDKTVKVWDAATGTLQQTLPVNGDVRSLLFDITNSILITNIGYLKLDETTNLPLPISSRVLSSKSHYKELGVSGS
jgi:WD40 repeat protein